MADIERNFMMNFTEVGTRNDNYKHYVFFGF